MNSDNDSAELIEWDSPSWDFPSLLRAVEVASSWAFLVILDEDKPGKTAFTRGVHGSLGYPAGDFLVFQSWIRFLPEDEFDKLAKFFISLPKSLRSFDIEVKVKTLQNTILWMKVQASKQSGQIVGVFRDITMERMAEEGLNRQYQLISGIFSSAPVPILLCDENLRVIECNPTGAKVLGMKNAAMAFGQSVLDFFPKSEKDIILETQRKSGLGTQMVGLKILVKGERRGEPVELSMTEVAHDQERKYYLLMVSLKSQKVPRPNEFQDLIEDIRTLLAKSSKDKPEAILKKVRLRLDPGTSGKIVAAVEDSEQSRLLLEKACEKLGASVVFFENGEGFLENFDKLDFDILLVDNKLPGINGIEVVKHIHQSEKIKDKNPFLIFLMTSYTKDVLEYVQKEEGFDGFLEKPVDLNSLRKILQMQPQPE